MNTLKIKPNPIAVEVTFTKDCLSVRLADGRIINVPLEWFPSLRDASAQQRNNYRLIGNGIGIHWEGIDEDLSVATLLALE